MATADSVKTALNAILSKANAKTGSADTTVAAAADRLIAGYNPNGITPSGTKTITENGTYDVSAFASALVNVAQNGQGAQIAAVHTVNIASALGNGTNSNVAILEGDQFVKTHYADNGFAAFLMPVTPLAGEANVMHFVYHGNANIGSTNAARYGYFLYSTSATAVGSVVNTVKISGSAYNISLRARNTGNINLYVASNRIVKPGTYMLVVLCMD